MKRFFAIVICLVLCTSASGGATVPRQPQTRASASENRNAAAIDRALRAVRFLIGLVPDGDLLIPPIPKPEGKTTTCCK
jgi:hypothetical protein